MNYGLHRHAYGYKYEKQIIHYTSIEAKCIIQKFSKIKNVMEYMRKLVLSEVLSQSKGKAEGIKILKLIILLAVCGLGVFAFSAPTQAAIIFDDSFESSIVDVNKWAYSISGTDWNISPVNFPVRYGSNSAKFYIRRADSTSYRAELTPKSLPLFRIGTDYWFSFSLYLPKDWINDIEGETVFQIHSNPDLSLGELWRSPPLQLQFDEDLNKWSWFNIWDPKKVTIDNDPRPEGGWGSIWSGDLPKGQWIDWVLHYKPDYSSGGILEIWKDGQQVVNKKGPNAYNDSGLFVKVGIYKSKWKYIITNVNARTLYIDEFRVGNNSSSYEEIKPRGLNTSGDIDSNGVINIKDIQACIKVITNSQTDTNIIAKCNALAAPVGNTNIKDIQVIIRAIIK